MVEAQKEYSDFVAGAVAVASWACSAVMVAVVVVAAPTAYIAVVAVEFGSYRSACLLLHSDRIHLL